MARNPRKWIELDGFGMFISLVPAGLSSGPFFPCIGRRERVITPRCVVADVATSFAECWGPPSEPQNWVEFPTRYGVKSHWSLAALSVPCGSLGFSHWHGWHTFCGSWWLNPPSFSRHHCHFWPGSKLSCWKTIPCLSHCCLSWYGRHDATSCGEAEVIPSLSESFQTLVWLVNELQ